MAMQGVLLYLHTFINEKNPDITISHQSIHMIKYFLSFLLFLVPMHINAQETAAPLPLISSLAGTYKGDMPCADCRKIESELQLDYETDSTGRFSLRDKYMGKQGSDIMSRIAGAWVVIKDVTDGVPVKLIVLNHDLQDKIIYYKVKQDGNLLPLDSDKQKISCPSDCTLKKIVQDADK